MTFRDESTSRAVSRLEIQRAIIKIWEEVLRIDHITADDNFFALGGNSLSASQAISRMARDLHADIALAEFFQRPTVSELTDVVAAGGSATVSDAAGGGQR